MRPYTQPAKCRSDCLDAAHQPPQYSCAQNLWELWAPAPSGEASPQAWLTCRSTEQRASSCIHPLLFVLELDGRRLWQNAVIATTRAEILNSSSAKRGIPSPFSCWY